MKKHKIIGGNNLELSVVETGNLQGKPIIFLHGISQCYQSFQKQYKSFLAEKYRIIIPDLRGHGQSQKVEGLREYTNSTLWADDLNSIIEYFELDNFCVVAWSYSGYFLLDYIKKYGVEKIAKINFVSSAVLLNKTADMVGDGLLKNIKNMSSKKEEENLLGITEFLKECFYSEPEKQEFKKIVEYNLLTPNFVKKALFTRTLNFDEELSQITCPVLISCGQNDNIILPSMSKYIQNMVKSDDIKFSEYKNCGHLTFFEYPQRFNKELDNFLSNL